MSWVRIDDAAPDHPKLVGLDDEAFALWVRALCYCARHATDGRIPLAAIPRMTSAKKWLYVAKRLHDAGLWDPTPEGYAVHDFLDFNPSAEQVKAKRDARAAAGRAGGIRSGQSRSKQEATGEAIASGVASTMSNPVPSPSRSPDQIPPVVPPAGGQPNGGTLVDLGPSKAKADRRKPQREMPEGWAPNENHRSHAASLGLDCAREERRFRGWTGAKAQRYADWDRAFTNHLDDQAERRGPASTPGQDERPASVIAEEARREREALQRIPALDGIGRGGL